MAGSEERSAEPGASPLERVRQAIQHSQYRDAITVTAKLPPRELHDDQAQPLIDCLLVAAAGLQDDSEDEVTAYNLVVGIGDALAATGRPFNTCSIAMRSRSRPSFHRGS